MGRQSMLFQLLFSCILFSGVSAEIGSPVAIRIACGSTESSTSPDGKLWLKDTGYSGGKTAIIKTRNVLAPQTSTARYFEMSDGPENCYNITTQNGHYHLRFFFAFGSADNSDLEPQFDVSLEGTLVFSLITGWGGSRGLSYPEALLYVEDGAVTACFHSSGHGNPSISSFEISQIDEQAYAPGSSWSHHVVLKVVKRVSCSEKNLRGYESRAGASVWGGDRFWDSDLGLDKGPTDSLTTTERINNTSVAPNFYPESIYQSASITSTGASVSYNIQIEPNQNYSLWFHFAEISSGIAAKEQRVFDILVNSQLIFPDVDIIGLAGAKFTALVLNKTVFVEGKTLVITFRPVQGSILVNAFEVYQLVRMEYTTDPKEVWALQALKNSLALPPRVGWNGDPCVPQEHPWNGINCGFHFDKGGWFIDGLDLDNQGLKGHIAKDISYLTNLQSINISGNSLYGQIPPEFGNLTNLVVLDLAYNALNGSIPETFGNLPRLKKLYLNGNRLSGAVPGILLAGPMHGASFNFSDNPGLCGIPGVRSCGFVLASGAKVGIAFGAFIFAMVAVTCGFCLWKRRQNIARSQRITTTRSAAYAKSRTQFTKDLQLARMHDLGSPYRERDPYREDEPI
ncbi:receptor-like protein 4 [Selaginella moellendorffii]|uniref:receptor-like protein 4 n=1 Tax=Selaginella moellendorffii TaxID=88036 RepID=UPI000D1C426B|nr:receptor-like protein 4 [Selaginella moellendorffii]XP_024531008.1 receptor-like protein 4 [Selaginella moellendorffii]XP_024531009.1 receptor-like protein 4 [Selaginella moellendorffii]|eukprot:XP_024531007.1 receptor-like protein 4 [Selaginella moellendorffii]